MRYVVSCDWLSVSCEAGSSFVLPDLGSELVSGAERFLCRPATEINPYYSFARCFLWRGQPAFHFFACPRHPDASRTACAVKVANRLLYAGGAGQSWVDLLRMFVAAAGLHINHLQRIDICADFNEFSGGRQVAQFIRDYFSKPRARHPSFIRRGSNKFRTYGQKRLGLIDFETLSFGTRDSPVQVNLYNKSQELKGHDKPYIRDCWAANGLDVERVWRVEFSLNPQGMMLHHVTADYITEVTFDIAGIYSKLSALFTTFAERYFKFYYVTKEDEVRRTKVEHLAPVVLFDYEMQTDYVPTSLCRKSDTGERERRAAKLLAHEIDYCALSPQQAETLRSTLGYLQHKWNIKHAASTSAADDVLRDFATGIAKVDTIYSEKGRRARVNRWLQVLRQKRYDARYDEFCKAFDYIDKNCEMFTASIQPIFDTADPDMLNL